MFLADEPIPSSAEDRLGRKPFAETLAKAILAQTGKEPLVVGLLGPWGSGKSSILKMTAESLKEQAGRVPEGERPVLMEFKPWMVADKSVLVTQFFDEVIAALGKINYAKVLKRSARLITTYSAILTPIGAIPTPAGKAVGVGTKILQGIASFVTWWFTQGESAQDQKLKIDAALAAQPHKLIIFIDEIDRLTAEETKQLFQVVKALANFPNTLYVLSFDEKIVEEQLGETQAGAAAFLDKIIQIPFHVPQIPIEDVHRFVEESVLHIFSKWSNEDFDRRHFGFLMRHGISRLVRNFRDAKRYLNVLSFNAAVAKTRISPSDLAGMTALQVLEPGVFEAVRSNKWLMTAPAREGVEPQLTRDNAVSLLNNVARMQRRGSEEPVNAIHQLLFPKVNAILIRPQDGGVVQHELLPEWRVRGRICDPSVFDLFYKLALPRGEYHNEEIDAILTSATSREGLAETLRQIGREGRAPTFLESLIHRAVVRRRDAEPLVRMTLGALIDAGDYLADDRIRKEGGVPVSNPTLLTDAMRATVKQLPEDARSPLVLECVKTTTQSLWTLILVRQALLNQSEDSKPIILDKISQWNKEGRLLAHRRVGVLVNFWESFGGDASDIKGVLEAILNDDAALLNLVREYSDETVTDRPSDYYSTPTFSVNFEGLRNRIDMKVAYSRLVAMLHSGLLSSDEERLVRKTLEHATAYKGAQ